MTDEWMGLIIELPADDAHALVLTMREKLGFTEVAEGELTRPDGARVSYLFSLSSTTAWRRPAPSPSPATDHQPESGSAPPG